MALFLAQNVEIAKRLGGMLAAAVARVHHRAWRVLRGHPRRAVMRMAQHDQVGVTGDDAHGIGQTLTLGGGARVHIGRADHGAAEPMHRGLEAEPGARRGFVKQRRHDQSGGGHNLFALRELPGKAVGKCKHAFDVRGLEILDRNDVKFCQPCHGIVRPSSRAEVRPHLALPITTASAPSISVSRTKTRWPFGACMFLPT